ncbi:hypothetical protein [Pseudomonas putida]
MARKQVTPTATAEAKDPGSTSESSSAQSEGAGMPLSTDAAPSPGPGESGSPVAAPAPEVIDASERQVGSAAEASVAADSLAAGSSAAVVGAGDPGGSVLASSAEANAGDSLNQPAVEKQVLANPNPVTLHIYPMRTYMDEGELRRRGGPAYSVPRRYAEELVERKLASFDPLEE